MGKEKKYVTSFLMLSWEMQIIIIIMIRNWVINFKILIIYYSVFLHRSRDVESVIRAECIKELCVWIQQYSSHYTDNLYLRHFGWALNDSVIILCLFFFIHVAHIQIYRLNFKKKEDSLTQQYIKYVNLIRVHLFDLKL